MVTPDLRAMVGPALGGLLPVRPPILIPAWPAALQTPEASKLRELFECYWPLQGVEAYHSLFGLQRCLRHDDLPVIHSHGKTPIASGWSGDIICVSIDDRLDISIASHELLYSSDGVKGQRGAKIYCSLDLDLGEYLNKLARIQATVKFVGGRLEFAPAAEDVVHADYDDAVKAHRGRRE